MPRVVSLPAVHVPDPQASARLVLRLPEGRIEGRVLNVPADSEEPLVVRARRHSTTAMAPFEEGAVAALVATDGTRPSP